ncbi:MAG: sulfatase [Planctomycetota bacterium]
MQKKPYGYGILPFRIRRNTGLLALATIALTTFAHSADRPNILLVLSDDHSVPHVSCYDDENTKRFKITPNLQRFAEQGMRFDRAYTSAPQCAPSRISIFACRSPVGLGVTRFAQPPRADVRFFTDVLRANGYWVGLDGRHQHLDGRVREAAHIDRALQEAGMQSLDERFDHFVRSAGTKGDSILRVADRVAAALDKVPKEKPFFLYFGFSQPHRKFAENHDGIDPNELNLPVDWPDLPEVRVDYARYLASVRELDHGFGLIMRLLKARGIEDNTLTIFMGDNGEAMLRGKGTLLDRGTHVPLMIRWPGRVEPGSKSSALVCGTDLGPTILAACGMKPLKHMTGVSFSRELLGGGRVARPEREGQEPTENRRYVFAERGWHWGPITRTDGLDLSRSVTSTRYRYIYNALPNRSYTPVDMPEKDAWKAIQLAHAANQLSPLHQQLYFRNPRPVVELYDLKNDPLELSNLAGNKSVAGVEKTLREELESWMIREHDFLPLPTHALQNTKRN